MIHGVVQENKDGTNIFSCVQDAEEREERNERVGVFLESFRRT